MINSRSIQSTDSVLSVARVCKLDEGEAWWIVGNPDIPQTTVHAERIYQSGAHVAHHVTDVHPAVPRHSANEIEC